MKIDRGYKTKPRALITALFEEHRDRLFTAKEVREHLRRQTGGAPDLSTVYRNLDSLTDKGVVLRFVSEDGTGAGYKYAGAGGGCLSHLHIKCIECADIVHLDCSFMKSVEEHALSEHGFHILPEQSILYGICDKCKRKKASEGGVLDE